jgi:hypothetical protein
VGSRAGVEPGAKDHDMSEKRKPDTPARDQAPG